MVLPDRAIPTGEYSQGLTEHFPVLDFSLGTRNKSYFEGREKTLQWLDLVQGSGSWDGLTDGLV